jgi:hypothetical protein
LTHLDVSHNALTDCLKIEPPLPQLRYARLCHNSIAALRPLAGFRNLQVQYTASGVQSPLSPQVHLRSALRPTRATQSR